MLSECIDSVELQGLAAANARRQLRIDSGRLAKSFTRLAEIVAAGAFVSDSDSGFAIDLYSLTVAIDDEYCCVLLCLMNVIPTSIS